MDIKSYNKALAEQVKKGLDFAFTKDMDPADEEVYYCCDTDGVKYKTIACRDHLLLHFSCMDIEPVWRHCHDHLVGRYYRYFQIELVNREHKKVLEIGIENECLTNIMKNFNAKEHTGIISGKKKFDAVFDFISKKMASIKRHFFASPFEMMLEAAHHNCNSPDHRRVPNLSYRTREGKEKVWLTFERDQFTTYYGISFEDRSEQQLAKIFLSELVDARKHVHNTPAINVAESELPQLLVESFPEEKNNKYEFANGIVSMTFSGKLVRKPPSIATYLAGFRTFIYYHVQAEKCYLHSRVLKRITAFQKDLSLAENDFIIKN